MYYMKYTLLLSYDCLRNFVGKKNFVFVNVCLLHACMVRFMQIFLSPKAFGGLASGHASTKSQLKACPLSSCQ